MQRNNSLSSFTFNELSNHIDDLRNQFVQASVTKASLMNTAMKDALNEFKLSPDESNYNMVSINSFLVPFYQTFDILIKLYDQLNQEELYSLVMQLINFAYLRSLAKDSCSYKTLCETINSICHDKFQLRDSNDLSLKEHYINLLAGDSKIDSNDKAIAITSVADFKKIIFELTDKIYQNDTKLRLRILFFLCKIRTAFHSWYTSDLISCLLQIKEINNFDIEILNHIEPRNCKIKDCENAIQLLEKHGAVGPDTDKLVFDFCLQFIQSDRHARESSLDEFESVINKLLTQFKKFISCDLRVEILSCKVDFLNPSSHCRTHFVADNEAKELAYIDLLRAMNEAGWEKVRANAGRGNCSQEGYTYIKTFMSLSKLFPNVSEELNVNEESSVNEESNVGEESKVSAPITIDDLYSMASRFNNLDFDDENDQAAAKIYASITEKICVNNMHTFMLTNQKISDRGLLEKWRLYFESMQVHTLLRLNYEKADQNPNVSYYEKLLAFTEKQLFHLNNRLKINRTSPNRFRFTVPIDGAEDKTNNQAHYDNNSVAFRNG